MATECTQESVLDFLSENGGRVKNKDLIEHFKVFLSSDNTKRTLFKDRFKRFVDNVAYVKQENGEKVVCLKKRYRQKMRGAQDDVEETRGGINALQLENKSLNHEDVSEDLKETSDAVQCEKLMVAESEAPDALCLSHIALTEKSSDCNVPQVSHVKKQMSQEDVKATGSEALRLYNSQSTGALELEAEAAAGKASHTSQIVISRRRSSRGSQRSLLASEDGAHDGSCDALSTDSSTPKGSRKNFIELMKSSSPQVRRSLLHRTSQEHMAARNRDSVSSSVDEDCVTLDPLEHEWMMCTADGQWDSLQRLLTCEPTLILKKDFVTGFTCLHWAAKQGKHELFAMLVNFAKQHNVAVNMNARSSAGYTPLHLAAMHNHIEVMKLLVGAYDVDVEVRDYSGKKAAQYLRASVTGDIKDIIGACGNSDTESVSGAGRWWLPKVLPSNLNPLRLLNPPEDLAADGQAKPRPLYRKSSIGRIRLQRNRFKTQIVHSTSFRENDEREDSLQSPVKSRPVSNLFG